MNSNFNGQNFDGGQAPNFDGGQAPNFDGGQAPQMWGTENFAGEEISSGNDNFVAGAPNDITEFVDTSTTGGFGEEKTFGNFAQGGLMPAMSGGRGNSFGQAQQPQQNHLR